MTRPVGWHDKAWYQDPFGGGGYTALPVLGTRDGFFPYPSAPTGQVHWTGTETAAEHAGYIEGAITAGDRAAREVLSALP